MTSTNTPSLTIPRLSKLFSSEIVDEDGYPYVLKLSATTSETMSSLRKYQSIDFDASKNWTGEKILIIIKSML